MEISGGLLLIWCSSKGRALFSFYSSVFFLGTCLEWGSSKHVSFVINIYSKCSLVDKITMLADIYLGKQSFKGVIRCFMGDFNMLFC